MKKRKEATPEQKAAAEARRAKFRGFAEKLAAMTDEQRAELSAQAGVVVTIEGRALSVKNAMLLVMQCPSVTMVGGFRQWINAGRCVRKGEKGLMIWVPTSKKEGGESGEAAPKDEGEERTRFVMGTVFDVSQTRAADEAPSLAENVAAAPLALMPPADLAPNYEEPEPIEVVAAAAPVVLEVVETPAPAAPVKHQQAEILELTFA